MLEILLPPPTYNSVENTGGFIFFFVTHAVIFTLKARIIPRKKISLGCLLPLNTKLTHPVRWKKRSKHLWILFAPVHTQFSRWRVKLSLPQQPMSLDPVTQNKRGSLGPRSNGVHQISKFTKSFYSTQHHNGHLIVTEDIKTKSISKPSVCEGHTAIRTPHHPAHGVLGPCLILTERVVC